MPLRRAPVPTPASIDVTVKKAQTMSAVQTTYNTAVVTFASEDAAKAAEGKIVVKRQNEKTLTEMKSQSQKVSGNTVEVKLYANFEKNTNYEFTADEAKTVLEVGALEVVDLKVFANPYSFVLSDAPVYPATSNMLRVYAYAKDVEGNPILLKEVTNDYDLKLRLASEDATKAYVSGNNLNITKDGDTVTVSAEYGKVNVSREFTATAAAAYKFVSIESVSLKGATNFDGSKWQANDGTLSIPKDEHSYQATQPRLDIVVKDTFGASLITNNVVGRSNTEVIDQVKWFTNDNRRLLIKYESKNPNVLMVSANDGTVYPVNEGTTEIVVSVEISQGTTTDKYVLGVIPVTVTSKRKLTTITPVVNNFNGVLNAGNFTQYSMGWSVKDQYGADYLAGKYTIDSKDFQDNIVGGAAEKWTGAFVAGGTNAWTGWAQIDVDAMGVKATDNAWTLKVVLKDTFNNVKTPTYAYVKVVDATGIVTGATTIPNEAKYFEQTAVKIDAVNTSVDPTDANNQNTIFSAGTGAYTLNYIDYSGVPEFEEDAKILVISYFKGLPLKVENYTFVRKDGTNVQGNVLTGYNKDSLFNYNAAGVANSSKAAQYVNEINQSMRNRAYNHMNLMSIVKADKDLVAGQNNDILSGSMTTTATASAVNTIDYKALNSAYSTLRANVVANADTDEVKFDTINGIHSTSGVAGAYTLTLRVPTVVTSIAADVDANVTYKATETVVSFTLNVVDNSKKPSAVVRANQEADCYSADAVLDVLFDSWTAPIGWAGADVTRARKSNGTIDKTMTVNGVTATISIPMSNPGYVRYDYSASSGVTGIFVYKVVVTITDGNFSYSYDVAVNQYVSHIGR